LPKIRYSVARSQGRTAPARGGAAAAADGSAEGPPPDITTGVAQDVFTILQNLAASNAMAMGGQGGLGAGARAPGGYPGAAMGAPGGASMAAGQPGIPALQGAELQSSLTRIQLGDLSGVGGGNFTVAAGDPGTTNVLRELRGTNVAAGMGSMDLM